jgi:hypothetical protein
LMEFKKNENKPGQSILGCFVFKQSTFDLLKMREIKFNNEIVKHYQDCLHLFNFENNTNVIFYVDARMHVNMVTFDNSGKVINRIPNLFNNDKVTQINILKLGDKYAIHAHFNQNSSTRSFRNQSINAEYASDSL